MKLMKFLFNKEFFVYPYVVFTILLVSYLYLSNPTAPSLGADAGQYQAVARDFQADMKIDELPLRPIGYPIFLIFTGSVEEPTRQLYLIQLIMHAFSVSVLVFLLKKIELPSLAILTFIVFAWLPPSVGHALKLQTETLTIACITIGIASLYLYLHGHSILTVIISGILLSFVALVRPTYQVLVPSLIVTLLLSHYFLQYMKEHRKAVWTAVTILSVSFIVIVFGYMLHNKANFGFFSIDPSTGFRLNTRTVRIIDYLPDEFAVERDILIRQRDARLISSNSYDLHTATQYIWTNNTINDLIDATGLSYLELNNRMMKANIGLIIGNPLEYGRDVASSMMTFWYPISWGPAPLLRQLWIIFHFLIMGIYFGLSSILFFAVILSYFFKGSKSSVYNLLKSQTDSISLLVVFFVIISQTVLISTLLEIGDPRYRIPVELLIYMSILINFQILYDLRKKISISVHIIDTPSEQSITS